MMRKLALLLSALALVCSAASGAGATLLDDFSDGDDAGWIRQDNLASAGGPGIFDASSGSYVLSSTAAVPVNREGLVAYWQDSTLNPAFANGVLTARVRMDSSSNVALVMRANTSAPAAWHGYSFAANNSLDLLLITRTLDNIDTTLAFTSFPVTDGTDYWLSAQALDSELSLNFWEVGTSEPLAPLLSASDSAITSTAIGLVAYHWESGGGPELISASFDDVQFVPEPTTGLLLGLGLLGVAVRRRV